MGMTITEKILAAHTDEKEVHAGQFIEAKLDIVLGNDITAPISINEFRKVGASKVFDPEKVVLLPDHFAPNKDIKSAEQCKMLREFAKEQKITHYYEVGRMGIEHVVLPEEGIVGPGDTVIGADSHTCSYGALGAFATGVGSTDLAFGMITGHTWFKVPQSMKFVCDGEFQPWVGGKDLILYIIGKIGVDGALYKAMEFTGSAISRLSMEGRLTLCNMAIEAGGKAGIVPPDEITGKYCEGRTEREPKYYESDPDAEYSDIIEIDVSKIEPQVALPHLPENAVPISKVPDVKLDQVFIGACTNGRIEDLRVAAEILKGKSVHPELRCIIVPGSQKVYQDALDEGLIDIFIKAGAVFSTPTCGPCLGGHMGILAAGEKCLATSNRNFVGRMGHTESEVYLTSPAVAAASAITGKITAPPEK